MQEGSLLNAFNFKHVPVLAHEVIQAINQLPAEMLEKGMIIDATLGGGGHSELILKNYPEIRIIGIDQDPHAILAASKRLNCFNSRLEIVSKNFANFIPPTKAILVLADLGVSSYQLEESTRGFSFNSISQLDMRMNPQEGFTAAQLIEELNEEELANLIYTYGEEKRSRKIARRIKSDLLKKGPYSSASELAYAIAGCFPPKLRYGRINPATRTFQALRIKVNKELEVLEKLLKDAPNWLITEGLFCVISFHSLEDRKVKQSFRSDNRLERITKKPILANAEEVSKNPRSRSAKLRIAKRKP